MHYVSVCARSTSDMYARVLHMHRTYLQQQTKCNICLQYSLQWSEKGRVVKYRGFPQLTCQILLAKPKNMSTLGNLTEAARTTHVQARGSRQAWQTYNFLTCRGYHSRYQKNTCPCLRAWPTRHPPTCQGYYPRHQTISLDTRQSPSTISFARKLAQSMWLMYFPGSTKYMWQATWHSITHVSPNTVAQTSNP